MAARERGAAEMTRKLVSSGMPLARHAIAVTETGTDMEEYDFDILE